MKKYLAALIMATAVASFAKTKMPPPAPLPAAITQAKTVFLVNGGGSDVAYDALYQDIKDWGKYQIVGDPSSADLIIEIRYWVDDNGERTYSFYNPAIKQTQVGSTEDIDPQLRLTIYDARSKAALWSSTDHRKLVRLRKNVDKEIANSAERLVDEMKARSQ